MSAGELESEWAGAPGRLIRDRYRRAAEVAKVRGKLPCLMINDLDAGVGIQEGVQRTVSSCPQIWQCVFPKWRSLGVTGKMIQLLIAYM